MINQKNLLVFFRIVTRLIFNLALVALLVGLLVSVTRTLLDLGLAFSQPTVRLGLKDLVTNILSLVVVLELVRAFVDYFEYERIRAEILVEVAVVFVLREMMLGLFSGDIRGLDVLVWSAGILALIGARALAIAFPYGKR
ncbi:MAG: phosphate-starvation-inducible PsiE family protein [Meiothermus sp.]|uniref:phosphate-starvation-inducible PsiE family protein n=1 Tax=Meiothermus sp. TaxID=1955249 RepID=UPI002619A055|nr:phosphate-starvation-inducible PsiE family protein [Meiothermus sp.]MCS7058308.1 phosphate-starvation-inducible PsiE family protein [Meiothermus sp.]MCX7740988.1 phosphate-starvation-inducible PsiE family protein [Meiothermus sp.]MDW8481161.1 phosphate-starvation-inducible PsiE family protein [Meiothermus sp.]